MEARAPGGRRLLVRGARQLVTVRGTSSPRRGLCLRNLGIIEDGSVLIEDGVIVEVGPTRRVENLARARGAEELDASAHVILPGFVDCSTQLVSAAPSVAFRDEEEPSGFWADGRAWDRRRGAAEVGRLTARSLEFRLRRSLASLVRHGTTAAGSTTAGMSDLGGEMKSLRVMAELDGKPLDVHASILAGRADDGAFDGRPEEYLKWLCSELLPRVRLRKLARSISLWSRHTEFTAAHARHLVETARRMRFRVRLCGSDGPWPTVQLALEYGATSVDDISFATEKEMAALGTSNILAVLCPVRFWHGRQFYPEVRTWIDQGVAVALGSGFHSLDCPSYSMPMAISFACTQLGMTAAEAITAATINSAHVLGIADRVGSIEPGKRADLVMLEASDYREIPHYVGANLVAATIKNGEQPAFARAAVGAAP